MPSINHKRKSKTSMKSFKSSKSSKRSKNVKRSKKTRSVVRKMRGGASKTIKTYKPIDFNNMNMNTDYYIVKDKEYINIGKYISNGFKDKVFFNKLQGSINMENTIVFTETS